MKVALDTSVLVAGLVAKHPMHARAALWLRHRPGDPVTTQAAAHALAETWATLTALPLQPRISGSQARRMLEQLSLHLDWRMVTPATYDRAISRCNERGLRSGAVYDALHYLSAEDDGAEVLLTFNRGDFDRVARADGPRVRVPSDPPSLDLT